MKHTAEEIAHAKNFLANLFKPIERRVYYRPSIDGQSTEMVEECTYPDIHTVCSAVSRSGMQRRYVVLVATSDRGIERISWAIARVTGIRLNQDEQSLVINGCGFNATQEIADALGRLLGIKIGYREL